MKRPERYRWPTALVHSGLWPKAEGGPVNPPVERASTLLLPDPEGLYGDGKVYGRMGMAVQDHLRAMLCDLEGAHGAHLTPNGLSACTLAILSSVKSGDHALITDAAYGPTRRFCERFLAQMGVEVTFYPPAAGEEVRDLIRPETRTHLHGSTGVVDL